MKKLLRLFAVLTIGVTASSSVVACNSTTEVHLVEDRTNTQINEQNKIDQWLDAGNKYTPDGKKIILIGLDGISYDRAAPFMLTGVNQSYVKRFSIQNYESFYGWTSIYFGNIFGNTKENSTRDIFATMNDGGLRTEAETNDYVGYVLDSYQAKGPNGDWYIADADNASVSFYTRSNEIKAKAELNIEKINEMIAKDSWDMFYIYNVIADECGHAHFGYDSTVMKTILSEYNKILRMLFDPTIFSPDKYLVMATTDHGRNADGWNHSDEEALAHESWVVANQDLDPIMNNDHESEQEQFTNFYDIKETMFKWMRGGQDEN